MRGGLPIVRLVVLYSISKYLEGYGIAEAEIDRSHLQWDCSNVERTNLEVFQTKLIHSSAGGSGEDDALISAVTH